MSRRKYYFSQKPGEAHKRGEMSGSARNFEALPLVAVFIRRAWFLWYFNMKKAISFQRSAFSQDTY
jgi:hypothetical protein